MLDVYVIFPRQADPQRYPAAALEVFCPCAFEVFHLPVIVTDDVPIDHW